MSKEKLVIGMPAGSLADPSRGGSLIELLDHAGFPTKDYEKGGPSSFPLQSYLIAWDGRPQEFGAQLAIDELDIAIAGDDWIRERILEFKYEYNQDIEMSRIMSLERGNVRIVIIKNPDDKEITCDEWLKSLLAEKKLVTMVSEMPYIALQWFKEKAESLGFGDSHKEFSVQKYKTPPKVDSGIVIYETWGKTEAKVKSNAVDFGLEITQTGSAIRNYGLQIIEEVMCSETSIWANPKIKENSGKYDLARMFLLNLYGSVYAEDKVILSFNTKKDDSPKVLRYLEENTLFADEPTINEGDKYIEFNIQVDAHSKEAPLAKLRFDLAEIGATGIETIPLDSSIPSIEVVNF